MVEYKKKQHNLNIFNNRFTQGGENLLAVKCFVFEFEYNYFEPFLNRLSACPCEQHQSKSTFIWYLLNISDEVN